MNVFSVRAEGLNPGGIGLRSICDFVQRRESLRYFRRAENTDGFESFCPSPVYRDFILKQPAIKREGTLKRVEARVGRSFEATSPKFVVFAFGH
jgi:hypothetical protein